MFLDHFCTWLVTSCSPGQAACQNLWSTPCGFQFHPTGAVIKINDLIFVVLAAQSRMTHSLSSKPFLTLSSTYQPNCLDPTLIAVCRRPSCSLTVEQGGCILRASGMVFIPQGWERAKQWANVLREFLTFSFSVLVAWLSIGFLGERGEEPGESAADSAADTFSDLYLFLQP